MATKRIGSKLTLAAKKGTPKASSPVATMSAPKDASPSRHVDADCPQQEMTKAPVFKLPNAIIDDKKAFFDAVFNWYQNRHHATAPSLPEGSAATTTTTPAQQIPWRLPPHNKDPYAIWVSEVMSQQTQLATVVRYWTAWMAKFPNVEALAAADGEAVRAVWAGMGYYRRADFLHKGAQFIVNTYRKENKGTQPFPTSYEEWVKQVPGVGPYTAAAITSLCFNVPATAVDGNVMRVMSRLCGTHGVDPKNAKHLGALQGTLNAGLLPSAASTRRQKKEVAAAGVTAGEECHTPFLELCPPDYRGRVNEGLMEIGASICKPNAEPLCSECPFSKPLQKHGGSSSANAAAVCMAYRMKTLGDIESIDGVIPMRGTAAASKDMCVDTFVVFARNSDLKSTSTSQLIKKEDASPIAKGAIVVSIKKEMAEDEVATAVVHSPRVQAMQTDAELFSVLCIRRPKGGLLSEMTDFPYEERLPPKGAPAKTTKKPTTAKGKSNDNSSCTLANSGSFIHVFSHIRMAVSVQAAVLDTPTEKTTTSVTSNASSIAEVAARTIKDASTRGDVTGKDAFWVPLSQLKDFPMSQLAVKSLQAALPMLLTRDRLTESEAKALAHLLCNRRVAGQKASRGS